MTTVEAWEAAANGEKWMAEVARQSVRLLGDETAPQDAERLRERQASMSSRPT